MNIFEFASKKKLRFVTSKGTASVEDVWDLPLESKVNVPTLDLLARQLNKAIKSTEEESFVSTIKKVDRDLVVMFEIVKHIIQAKLRAAETAAKAAETKQFRQKVMEIISNKEDQRLEGKSLKQLQALLGDDPDLDDE